VAFALLKVASPANGVFGLTGPQSTNPCDGENIAVRKSSLPRLEF